MSKNKFNDCDIVYFHVDKENCSGLYEIEVISDEKVYLRVNDFDDIIFSRESGHMIGENFSNIFYKGSYIEKNEELIEMSKLLDFILYESKYPCHSCEKFEKYFSKILHIPNNCARFLCNDNVCPNEKEILKLYMRTDNNFK